MLCARCHNPIRNEMDQFEGYCQECSDWTTPGHLGRIWTPIHFDRVGKPIPLSLWAMLIENHLDTVVQQDVIDTDEGEVRISTRWFGIDMGYGFYGVPPLVYETMIFGGKHDQYQERYPTEAAALAGHDQAVALVRHTAHVG